MQGGVVTTRTEGPAEVVGLGAVCDLHRASADGRTVTQEVMNVVLPDDDDGEDHPWEWLAELARGRGLRVTGHDLRGLPYEVELTDRVLRLVAAG